MQVFIGYDPREGIAFSVARHTLRRHVPPSTEIHGLLLKDLQDEYLHTRPIEYRDGPNDTKTMWCPISEAPLSTEHANARFLVPFLSPTGWSMFMDGDMLVRKDLASVFDSLDRKHAVYVVKHDFRPKAQVKMDNQIQTRYPRKAWSSLMIFNSDHPSNRKLTLEMINTLPGRDLHAFCWLEDHEIGELDPAYNFLVGHTSNVVDPAIVHFTEGLPNLPKYANVAFANEWHAAHRDYVRAG